MLINDSSIKLTRKELTSTSSEKWAVTMKMENILLFLNGSASPAEVVKWELHSFRVSAHNAMTRKYNNRGRDNVTIKSKSNWLVCLLSIKSLVRLSVEQDAALIQDNLAFQKNFRAMANLTEASGIPNTIGEDSGRSAPALQSSEML